jgi:hypothetical protein
MIFYLFAAAVVVLAVIAALRTARASRPPRAEAPPPEPPIAEEAPREAAPSLEEVLAKMAAVRRSSWLPETVEGDGAATDSRFSGAPSLAAGEAWPACGNCGRPMQLFVQLNARDLPPAGRARLGERMLLQFFYCTSDDPLCEDDCDAWRPHGASTLLRLIPAPEDGSGQAAAIPDDMFPPKRITGWTEREDYPAWDEYGELGVHLSDDEEEAAADAFPLAGEKLLGWPCWVQSPDYPACRVCGARMEFLFQIDSEKNLPHMFGDVGMGHITQCRDHPAELAFGWACH